MQTLIRTALAGALAVGVALVALSVVQAQTPSPGQIFRDCADVCPEMVVVPSGSFTMGRSDGVSREGPRRSVGIAQPFAVGRFEVTFAEWDACVDDGGCPRADSATEGPGHDEGWGRGRRPVINVTWQEANLYVLWLSSRTGKRYRLLSEAEWEYVARAGTGSAFGSGRNSPLTEEEANFNNQFGRTVSVGTYQANRFGVHDMHGNVYEWVRDCWNPNYSNAPTEGSAWTQGNCSLRVARGGYWRAGSDTARADSREWQQATQRENYLGFRVARTL